MRPSLFDNLPPDQMNWLPYNLRYDDTQLVVDWCHAADGRLEEPFFDQTIHRLLQLPGHSSRSTHFDALAGINSKKTVCGPGGFIFHMSRCGSTLITQMLGSLRQLVVFSEPAILEIVLRDTYAPVAVSKEQKKWLLENVIQTLLGYEAGRQAAFIKFSARAVLDHALINQCHPSVPSVFVYREPLEVLVALVGRQTDQLPPNLENAGLLNADPQVIRKMRPAEFWARVLANECAAALEMCARAPALLVNYSQLPEAVWTEIANYCGVVLSLEDIAQMRKLILRSAKEPGKPFNNDSAAKREAATQEMHTLVEHFVRPYYERLESLRLAVGRHTRGSGSVSGIEGQDAGSDDHKSLQAGL